MGFPLRQDWRNQIRRCLLTSGVPSYRYTLGSNPRIGSIGRRTHFCTCFAKCLRKRIHHGRTLSPFVSSEAELARIGQRGSVHNRVEGAPRGGGEGGRERWWGGMVVSSKKPGAVVVRSKVCDRIVLVLAWASLAANVALAGWAVATTPVSAWMGREVEGLSTLPHVRPSQAVLEQDSEVERAPDAREERGEPSDVEAHRGVEQKEDVKEVIATPVPANETPVPASETPAAASTKLGENGTERIAKEGNGTNVERGHQGEPETKEKVQDAEKVEGASGEVVIFHQECLRYQDWQTVGLIATHKAHAGRGSRLVRLLSCGEGAPNSRKSDVGTVVGVETLVVGGHPDVEDGYVVRHKPHAVGEWLQKEGVPEEETVVIVDPDMLWLRPLGVRAEKGVLKSAYYAIGDVWAKEGTPSARVCANIGEKCMGLSEEASSAFQVGVPYIVHREDLATLAPIWVSRLDELRAAGEDSWCSDMYAFSMAAMEVGLRAEVVEGLSAHATEMRHPESVFTYPGVFDQGQGEFQPGMLPALLHYPMEFSMGISQVQGEAPFDFAKGLTDGEMKEFAWDKGLAGEMWNKHGLHDRDFVACVGSPTPASSGGASAPVAAPCKQDEGMCAKDREQKRAWIDEAFTQHCTHPVLGRTSAAMAWMCRTVTQTLASALLEYDDTHCAPSAALEAEASA